MTATGARTEADKVIVHNPANGSIVGTVPVDTPETVAAKARELRRAQPEWEAIGPRGRKRWLLAYQGWILDNADHITEVLMSEAGKSRGDASLEPVAVADAVNYWASNAAKFLADKHPKAHSPLYQVKRFTTAYRPYQLVGVITPWNFPFGMPGLDVPPALAAGAAVLLKPSEVTPLSAVEFVRGWAEVGAPPVLGLVTGYGEIGCGPDRQRRLSAVHRVHRDRAQGGRRLCAAVDPVRAGTRRQGSGHRSGRRRPGTRSQRHRLGRAVQFGSGVCIRSNASMSKSRSTTSSSTSWPPRCAR